MTKPIKLVGPTVWLKLAKKWPLVSVIVLNYNGKNFLNKCLESVLNSNYSNFEVILVDNRSTDGSIDLAEENFGTDPRLNIIKNDENLGFAEGNNIGVKYSKGKYVAFLNFDTFVDREWLRELVKVMEDDDNVGAAQSKLLQLGRSKCFDSAGDFIDYYGLSIRRGMGEEDQGQYNRIEEIFSARGAAMIVRFCVLEEVGLFDPKFFLVHEDIDLCWRIRLRGYKIVYVPRSVVYHFGEVASGGLQIGTKLFYNTKNHLTMMLKNCSLKNLIKFNPLVVTMAFMICDLLRRKNPRLLLARLKAIVWILANFRYIWKKRLVVQKHIKKQQDAEVMRYMLKTDFSRLTRLFINLLKYGDAYATKSYWYDMQGIG